jgi:hypothetical protein
MKANGRGKPKDASIASAEVVHPANRLVNKGREDVKVIIVGDIEAMVCAIHSPQSLAASFALVARLGDLGNDQCCVVVALLRALVELPCPVEQHRDARHAVGPVERQFMGARHVPWKFVARHKVVDLDVIALRVELFDLAESIVASHIGVDLQR